MIESSDPSIACDVMASMPHKDATQDSTNSHRGNVMASQSFYAASCLRDQPQLRQHSHSADKDTCHPQSVKEWTIIDIAVQHSCEEKRKDGHGQDRQGIF